MGFVFQTVSGEPLKAGEVTVTPRSRVLVIDLPFGALVWHRPSAVVVECNGESRVMPIVDVTRALQLALVAVGVLFLIVAGVQAGRQKGR